MLGGNNTYSGTTSLTSGALNVTGSLGNTPVIVSGGALSLQSTGAVSQNTITVGGGSLLETVPNAISGNAALTVNSGAATLSQTNNYTGATSVTGGLLSVTGSLGNTAVSLSGGTLSLQSAGAINQNLLTVSGGGSLPRPPAMPSAARPD